MLDHWISWADIRPSCHYNARPISREINLVVIHSISLPKGQFGGSGVLRMLQGYPVFDTVEQSGLMESQLNQYAVSSHFLLRRGGELIQFVPVSLRAWHAGLSMFQGKPNCNDFSIGVELEGADNVAYTDWQYDSLQRLIHELALRYPIEDIVGHSDIAPQRKTDPGLFFDWERVAL